MAANARGAGKEVSTRGPNRYVSPAPREGVNRVDGTFRVYRVFSAVPHLNLVDVAADRLYTVYESGYPEDRQRVVDDLSTGDLLDATVAGDPDAPDDPWRVVDPEPKPDGSVSVDFATGVDYPPVARETWARAREAAGDDPVEPAGRTLGADGAAGEVWVQPRDAVPDGAFTRRAATGLVPLEPLFRGLPSADAPASELLVVDADEPGASRNTEPYGVLFFFTAAGRDLADEYRERLDLPRGEDSRPDFDPY